MLHTRPRSRWLPQVTQLEDRCTPASFAGNVITLDDANEILTISTAVSGTYTLSSTVDVNGTAGPVAFAPAAGPVTVVDSAAGTGVTFATSTAIYTNPFAVTLDATPAVVTFTGASAFGANDLSVTTARNILVDTGASVTATSGNIAFSANRQATPTLANFIGVDVLGTVTSVTGNVTVSGSGGNTNADGAMGVRVSGGATLGTTGSGAVSVTGTGGGSFATFSGGLSGHDGVVVMGAGSAILSGGGNVTVVGDYTAANGASMNYGVLVSAGGRIAAGGTGAVSVTGGGNDNGVPSANAADVLMLITGTGSAVTSAGGPVTIRRSSTTFRLGAITFADGATVSSGANAPVTISANSLNIAPTATVSAGTGTVTILPVQAVLGLGRNDYFNNYPSSVIVDVTTLGLTDAELDRITAGALVFGDSTTRLVLQNAITRPAATDVRFVGQSLELAGAPSFNTGGGPLTLTVGGTINREYGFQALTASDVVFTASSVSFSPGATLLIPPHGSATVNGSYTRAVPLLRVNGALDLTNLTAQVDTNGVVNTLPTPQPGDVFTVATATTLTGSFVGRPAGSTVTVNGVLMTVSYTGTTATLSVPVPLPPQIRVVTAVGDTVTVLNPRDGSTRTLVPFAGFRVSVASADLNEDGVPDVVVGAGPGGGPHVRVFDGLTGAELANFFAFDPAFRGGVNVAAGSTSTTGTPQIVVGAGPGGGPHVKVIDARLMQQVQPNGEIAPAVLLANFFAFDPAFTGGVSVALGGHSIRGGYRDVVVGAGPGGGPHVKVIDGDRYSQVQPNGMIADSALQASFFAFDPAFTGGVNVGATSRRFAVGAGAGGEPQVKTYRLAGGQIEERSEVAFDPAFRGGVRVGFADIDADGDQDLLTGAGPGGGPHLKAFNIAPFGLVRSVFVGDPTDTRGVVV